VLRVAAISGSLRRASANTGLIRAGKAPHPCLGYYYLFSYLTADC
jgi:NAD(P)H-dependent FMN reductase